MAGDIVVIQSLVECYTKRGGPFYDPARIAKLLRDFFEKNERLYGTHVTEKLGLGWPIAAHYLAELYDREDRASSVRRLRWLVRGSNAGCQYCSFGAARDYLMQSDLRERLHGWAYMERAAQQSSELAMVAVEIPTLICEPSHHRISESIERLLGMARKGESTAMVALGWILMKQRERAAHQQALRWWRKAEKLGAGIAAWNLAISYARGIGVTTDMRLARQFYRRAMMADSEMVGKAGAESIEDDWCPEANECAAPTWLMEVMDVAHEVYRRKRNEE